MNKKIQSNIFLLLTALIWGFAFVAQRSVMDYLGPFLYSGIRMYLGSLSLLVFIYITNKFEKTRELFSGDITVPSDNQKQKNLLLQGGLVCGIVMYFAGNFQQVGLVFTTASKTGFITTLYIIIVPLIGILLKHKTTYNTWLGVVLATIGLYFLCITESLTIELGDFVVLIGAVFWALHILCMDYYAPKVHVMKLVSIQFFVAGTLSFITAIFVDSWFCSDVQLTNLIYAIPSILYVGIMSSAGAATFQGLGQKHANPTTASIILSTEAVFGAIFGFLVLHEILSIRETVGCILMFTAIIIVQLPTRSERMKSASTKN
ncbi:MAG: DMT family transporter [Eubacteriales bacterium]|nr:DMT family transporter [Eubacteriales bacterium]